jgi:sulfotransferase family protein
MGLRWRLRRLRPIARKPLVLARHRGLRPADVVLDEYPKSGGTWVAFMLGELLTGREVDFENQGAAVPAVGAHRGTAPSLPGSGRLLRTHEPYRPEYGKAVYLVRHVADVAVSYFHNLRWMKVDVDFERFLPALLRGQVDGYGPWASHVESWLDAAEADVLLVRFEDLKASPEAEVRRMVDFLGVAADDEIIARAVANNSIERMRRKQDQARATVFNDRDPSGDFVRTGTVGDSAVLLDEKGHRLIERYAGRALERLGYPIRLAGA